MTGDAKSRGQTTGDRGQSDSELVRRYAEERSEDAFAELVRRHLGLVYFAALRRVGDSHQAQDVTQAVFTDLARKAGSLWRRPVLASWLHTSTRFAASKTRRSEQRRQKREQEAETMNALLQDESTTAEWERLKPLIDDTLHELNERDREAVLLRFFEGRAFGEIGETLQVTEDAARMRVERALGKLHALLARRGITSTSAALGLMLANEAAGTVPAGMAASVTAAALAGAATVAGGMGLVAGVVQFMSMSKILAGAAALALATLVVTTGYEARAGRAAEISRATAQSDNEVLAARLRELRQRADAAEKLREAALKAAPTPRPAVPAASRIDPLAEGAALMARHPEVREAVIGYNRASLRTTYGPLFRALQLAPAQIDRCVDLLLMRGGSTPQLAGPNGPLRFALEGNPAEAERQLHELLGQEGFNQYRDFSSDLTSLRATASLERHQIATTPLQLASALHATATPLDAAQAERLRDVVTRSLVSVEWSDRRQYNWDKILAEARDFLAEPQLAMLERQGLSDRYLQAMNRTLFQQRQAGATATSARK